MNRQTKKLPAYQDGRTKLKAIFFY